MTNWNCAFKRGQIELQREMNERSKAEEQLRQAQKMEALGTMSGGIAHDFNNILAAIIGFSELLEGHVAKGSRDARHLRRIMEAGIRGRELVRQMLAFARKAEQEKKPLPVSSIVKESVKLLRATTPSTINIRVNASSEALILGDPTQIQQVLMNLCTNATYAMREKGGSLDIELSDYSVSPSNGDPHGIAPGHYVKLTVRDTGTGISSDIMDKIFDPFFTTKKVGEGTGLGLSVVHGIVKQHDGLHHGRERTRQGAPPSPYTSLRSQENLKPMRPSDDEIPTGSERILFVDDEEVLVEMGEDILAELGYEVTSRMNSREALALFKSGPIPVRSRHYRPDHAGDDGSRACKRGPRYQSGYAHHHVHGLQLCGRCRQGQGRRHQGLRHEAPHEKGDCEDDKKGARRIACGCRFHTAIDKIPHIAQCTSSRSKH